MTLLVEIQNAAVDSNSNLGTLLRKCKLLAARLGSQPLEDWLIWESNGYPEDIEVPNYRIWPLQVKGHFAGPFNSGLRNAPIPLVCLPQNGRQHYEHYECRLSITSVETTLKKSKTGMVQVSTGDLSVILGTNVYENQNCLQAWAEFGTNNLVELLNVVRNRILDFSLALWKESPKAGDDNDGKSKHIESKKVTQIFNTTVYNGSANLIGTASGSTIEYNIGTKDIESLIKVLRSKGIEDPDLVELREIIGSEIETNNNKKFGPRVSAWIAKMIGKAADGTWNISLGAAGNILAQVIGKYYGLN